MNILDTYKKFERSLIKEYQTYNLYQVYGVKENGERVPLYKECENKGGEHNKAV